MPQQDAPLYVVALERASLADEAAGTVADQLAERHRRGARLLVVVAGQAGRAEAALTARGLSVLAADASAGRLVRGTPAVVDAARLAALLAAFDAVCLSTSAAQADVLAAKAARALAADHVRFVTGTAGLPAHPGHGGAVAGPATRAGRDVGPGEGERFGGPEARLKARAAELALKGTGDVAVTGPHTMSAAGGTRFWRAAPPAPDLELLTRAVEISSVSGDEGELAAYLAGWCAERGLDAAVDGAGNLVATRGSGGAHRLLLLGHLDTVPYRWPVRWDGATLTGRGCVDAKGSLACYLETLAELDPPPGVEIRVVGAVEEELTSAGAFAVRDAYPADAVVIGEPSGAAGLTVGYYGLCKIRMTVAENTAHTAGKGVTTAADRLHDAVARLRAELGALSEDALVAVLASHARNRGDRQVGEAVVDIRVPQRLDVDELLALVGRVEKGGGAPLRIEVLRCTPGVATPRSSALVRAFAQAFRTTGERPRYVSKKGSSDMNTLATTWRGVPMVAYGPGDSRLDHTPHERLDVADYRRARAVLGAAIAAWSRIVAAQGGGGGRAAAISYTRSMLPS
ncbi:MAG TPA: M20/M25/M40 family metallo-hydrolase [Streptosporangiaceae bacterium]